MGDLASRMSSMKVVGDSLSEDERASLIHTSHHNLDDDVDFELFLRVSHRTLSPALFPDPPKMLIGLLGLYQVYLKLHGHASARTGGSAAKNSSAFLKAATTTLLHTISESEKASYVAHINNYLAGDEFLERYLPIDPATNDLFEIAKDGVLLW